MGPERVPAPAARGLAGAVRPAAGAAAIVLLAACGADSEREDWSAREGLTYCGEVRMGAGVAFEEASADGIRCLQKALDGERGAELRVTSLTVEGDPITQYFRVTSTGRFEIYTDATRDTYGSGRWEYQDCGPRREVSRLSC